MILVGVTSRGPGWRSRRWRRGSTARTVLIGLPDRAALHGVLTEVEALGLDLLEVRQLTPDCKSQGLGDNRSP